MPILNWIGKKTVINHHKDVPFKFLKRNDSKSMGNSENLLIEGDNLEALKSLLPYYKGKIKCIYIDPPYNTGNENWVYNDNVNSPKIKKWLGKVVGSEGEDLSRHDKWLCMMYPRLKLLRELLSDEGVIFVSIDDNEMNYLKLMMDEIFNSQNFISELVWKKKYTGGKHANHFVDFHEYITVYGKNKENVGKFFVDRTEKEKKKFVYKDKNFKKWGKYYHRPFKSNLEERKTLVYPIKLPNGKEITTQWIAGKERFEEWKNNGKILFKQLKTGEFNVYVKYYENEKGDNGVMMPSIIEGIYNNDAASELKNIFEVDSVRESKKLFANPKPLELINKLIMTSTKKEDIILDSFAGSGTTGHAVLELNKKDNGNRKFILIELESKIGKNITSKRLSTVIKSIGGGGAENIGFTYCTLGNELFDKNGKIDPNCTFNQLANYIFFTETKTPLDKKKSTGVFLGESKYAKIYLIFHGIEKKNILNYNILKSLPKDTKKIVYADSCNIAQNRLDEHHVTFKQIPYEVKSF